MVVKLWKFRFWNPNVHHHHHISNQAVVNRDSFKVEDPRRPWPAWWAQHFLEQTHWVSVIRTNEAYLGYSGDDIFLKTKWQDSEKNRVDLTSFCYRPDTSNVDGRCICDGRGDGFRNPLQNVPVGWKSGEFQYWACGCLVIGADQHKAGEKHWRDLVDQSKDFAVELWSARNLSQFGAEIILIFLWSETILRCLKIYLRLKPCFAQSVHVSRHVGDFCV